MCMGATRQALEVECCRQVYVCHVAPSMVEVPLPSSSMITRDRSLRLDSRYAASFISVWKVLMLCSMSSLVPMRDMMRSRTARVACRAGTKQPIWAMTTIKAICLMYTVYSIDGSTASMR